MHYLKVAIMRNCRTAAYNSLTKALKKNRRRNIIWFTPPYHANVTTNIGRTFLSLLDKHFPKSHRLHSILNRKTVKLSYSCSKNMKAIIQNHNAKITNASATEKDRPCNCRKKDSCPVNGECCTKTVVYHATTNVNGNEAHYIGSTEGEFKTRFNGHTQSFKSEAKKTSTTLAQFVWDNNLNPKPSITWSILKKVQKLRAGSKICSVCSTEKLLILKHLKDPGYLNKRNELAKKCPHRAKHMLWDLV